MIQFANNESLPSLESSRCEYKLKLPDTTNLARLIVGMANSKGGRIVVGVRDTPREVVGIVPDQRIEEHVANIAAEVCSPRVEYELSYETIYDKTVMILQIEPGHSKPYYVTKLGLHKGTYIRIGSTTRLADRDTLKRLTREGENRSFDSEPSAISKEYVDPSLAQFYLKQRKARLGISSTEMSKSLLSDLNLMCDSKLTIAGALLLCSNPQRDPQLGSAIIRAARFKGVVATDFIDQQEVSGDIAKQIEESVKFVLRNTPHRGVQRGLVRADEYEYPVQILREVIANAVAHREYAIVNEPIRIAVYDDRIEVVSPGGLPGTLTVDSLLHRQHSRNPILAKRLFEMGYIEAWGLGIDAIVRWAAESSRTPPKFIDQDEQFSVTLYAARDDLRADSPKRGSRKELLIERERRILEQFQREECLTNIDLQERCGLSKTQVRSILCSLIKQKRIKARGKGPATIYKLSSPKN